MFERAIVLHDPVVRDGSDGGGVVHDVAHDVHEAEGDEVREERVGCDGDVGGGAGGGCRPVRGGGRTRFVHRVVRVEVVVPDPDGTTEQEGLPSGRRFKRRSASQFFTGVLDLFKIFKSFPPVGLKDVPPSPTPPLHLALGHLPLPRVAMESHGGAQTDQLATDLPDLLAVLLPDVEIVHLDEEVLHEAHAERLGLDEVSLVRELGEGEVVRSE